MVKLARIWGSEHPILFALIIMWMTPNFKVITVLSCVFFFSVNYRYSQADLEVTIGPTFPENVLKQWKLTGVNFFSENSF